MQIYSMSVPQVAKATSLSVPTIWRMIKRGELESQKVGGRRVVNVESIKRAVGA